MLDNFSTGNRANLDGVDADVEIVEGDLRSYERVHTAVRGIDVVFHQGALGSVPRSVQDPLTTTAVNVEGTLNVLLAARDEGVRRVVFASSSSVYGDGGTFPRVETAAPNPISPYAVAKLAAERYCVSFHRVYGLETVALRYFNVFGPRQDPSSQYAAVVPRFITAIAEGRARRRSTATASSRATSPTSPTSSPRTSLAAERRRRGGQRAQRRDGRLGDGQRARRHDRPPARHARREARSSRRARATSSSRGPTSRPRPSVARLSSPSRRVRGRPTPHDREPRGRAGLTMGHAFGSLDELGDGYGFRKVRRALGVDGVRRQRDRDARPGSRASSTTTRPRTSSTSSTRARRASRSTARSGCSGPAGSCTSSRRPRARSRTRGDDDLVLLVIGGKDGYVERDGHLVDAADLERRQSFG